MRAEIPSAENSLNTLGTSAELLGRFQQGDDRAADEIFHRYVDRLTRLARARLSPKLARRTDPEDVVMSAWRSFFLAAGAGRFSLKRSGDLWRLLVAITLHKLYHQARRHSAEMRSLSAEQPFDQTGALPADISNREPTPEEAVALADEMEHILAGLDPFGRRVLELRLQGQTLAEISLDTGRSERSVRRRLAEIRTQLTQRLGNENA